MNVLFGITSYPDSLNCYHPTPATKSIFTISFFVTMIKKIILSLFVIAAMLACAGNTNTVEGEAIYKKYCITCHGADGKLGLNGAKDMTISEMTEAERIELVKKGRNTMTPFESILSEEQIKAVVAYSMTLKAK